MNSELFAVCSAHRGLFTDRFGEKQSRDHYLFPLASRLPSDPQGPMTAALCVPVQVVCGTAHLRGPHGEDRSNVAGIPSTDLSSTRGTKMARRGS